MGVMRNKTNERNFVDIFPTLSLVGLEPVKICFQIRNVAVGFAVTLHRGK